jgi:mannosyl-3-phosphoglycerate phosphatase family protein
MEGWCMGSTAQNESALNQAVNSLESEEDSDGEWRHYVNDQLSRFYPKLFELVDLWVMLKAPSFESVYQWRLEQEDKLRAVATNGTHVMSEEQVARFIKFYQRITEHTLMTLPEQVHYLYEMDDTRTITKMTCRSSIFSHMEKHWLVFTDMDGSLLDHHDYSYDPAIPTLEALEQAQIPVIPVTSKTQAEVEFIRETIDNTHPFIVENGAAVCIPVGYFPHQPAGTEQQGQFWIKSFCESRSRWQALIDELRPRYPDQFKTFAEAGIDGIIAMTGLNVHAAALAAHRQYGEPVSWHGNGQLKQSFINDLKAAGANVLEGGRFIHVSGNCDKGRALNWLKQIYQSAYPTKQMISLGIGDSHNDKAMLESADHALIIRSPTHGLPEVNRQNNLTISTHTGPKGWAEGVNNIIDAALHSNSSQQPRGNHG